MKKFLDSVGGGIASCYTSLKYGKDKVSGSGVATMSFYELQAATLQTKQEMSFSEFKNKVVLVVNIASMCGYTAGNNKFLSDLAEKYKSREDFVILAFPCGQFAGQEHADETKVCSAHMDGLKNCKDCIGRSLLLMQKVDVNGEAAHDVFKFLRFHSPELGPAETDKPENAKVAPIPWNYGKFLVDKDGRVLKFFKSGAYDEVHDAIAKLLV